MDTQPAPGELVTQTGHQLVEGSLPHHGDRGQCRTFPPTAGGRFGKHLLKFEGLERVDEFLGDLPKRQRVDTGTVRDVLLNEDLELLVRVGAAEVGAYLEKARLSGQPFDQ